jgi:transcriptional regulator with XRE-family HTH domain
MVQNMDSEQKIEERQKWNAPFLRAFNYLLECYEVTKGELCKMMGIQPGLISNYAKGTKKVSIDTMNALARVSNNTPGGMLNVNYMLGKSKYMLLSNVPDEEILEEYNPDREVLEKRKAAPRTPDMSSYINALLAKSDETIASLKRELDEKDDIIKAKDDQIALMQESISTKDDYIATLKSRITELRNIIDSKDIGMPDYITPGVAEKPSKRARK